MIAVLMTVLLGSAQAKDIRLCGQWTPNLREGGTDGGDNDGIDANGDGVDDNDRPDRFITNAPTPTHGLMYYAEVKPPGSNWSYLGAGFLEARGGNAGCTSLMSVTVTPFLPPKVRLTVYSSFASGGSVMTVYESVANPVQGSATSSSTNVTSSSPTRIDVDVGTGDPRIDTAIVMAWALDRENGGTSGMPYDVYTEFSSKDGGGHRWEEKELLVGDESEARRILHELGHAITANIAYDENGAEGDPWAKTYGWTNIDIPNTPLPGMFEDADSACERGDDNPSIANESRHFTASDEATSAAITEGLARYYVAQTVNRVDEGDCYMFGRTDWDHDLDSDEHGLSPNSSRWYSCDDLPRPASMLNPLVTLTGEDYWDDVCYQVLPAPINVSETLTVATSYDWLRGFWDLETNFAPPLDPLSFTDIATIFAKARPHDWLEGWQHDLVQEDDFPHVRMIDAADEYGVLDEWMDQIGNGLDR